MADTRAYSPMSVQVGFVFGFLTSYSLAAVTLSYTAPNREAVSLREAAPLFPRQAQILQDAPTIPASQAPSGPDRSATMPDGPTHQEYLDTKLEVITAQTDAKFERVLGEMRAANAAVIGRFDTLDVKVEAA
ncbi:MAG TPA: hypothetical protein VME40_01445, partial [Caulobacteraceae bacterium]|nr:hypothetical protein [Caulobacteraceae bacterium]